MRKIKFKGICLDRNSFYQQWVIGDLCITKDSNKNEYPTICMDDHIIDFKIYPETLCQLTEYKDKNNQEIWEHDLLEIGEEWDDKNIGEVIFAQGGFQIKEHGSNINLYLDSYKKEDLKKIGNRYDKDMRNIF